MASAGYDYSYGYSWSIGRLVDGRYGMFPEYERTTRTLYLTIKEPVAGENPNTDSSYQVIGGLPDDVTVDKFKWDMDKDTVFQAGKEYMLALYLTVPKENPSGVWAEDSDRNYITVYINGVNCTKYNARQGFWSDTENCEWCISEHWLTPVPGDIQTVRIEVEEPVAGQPLNFHVQSLGEPEAYMAGAYSYEGKPYDAVWFDTTGDEFNQLNPGAVARSDGGTYRLMVFVHPKEGHQFAKATEKTRTFWVNGQKAKGSCNTAGSQGGEIRRELQEKLAKDGAEALLEALRALGQETELILSDWGAETIRLETDLTVEQVKALADRVYDNRNMAAQAASGSSCADAMVIAPCSMKTLAGIAMGYDDSLLVRAADVMLKERRRLILLTRETPLNLSHIRNMETVTLMGGIILPPVPAFYSRPQTVDDIVDQTVSRTLRLLGLDGGERFRWNGNG